ncbi:ATP-dependent helicase, partial [Stomatohabitans albus]|uniref:ATP-dependent helicase n=1 Tax=Stomatohabitans albus TaxID=3110766 RepID=UPI00300CCBD7
MPDHTEPDTSLPDLNDQIDTLNEAQREAVLFGLGPLMVVAGAGSGKTRVLTHRIARLIADGAHPQSILAITFTNKAAQEMKDRVGRLVGDNLVGITRDTAGVIQTQRWGGMWVQTFHAACARILRKEAHRLGYNKQFTIHDTGDTRQMIKRCAEANQVDTKRQTPRMLAQMISAAKNELIDYETYGEQAQSLQEKIAADVYRTYEERMVLANAMDFDDLLYKTVNIFELFDDVRDYYREQFQHILVDEWQDTNLAQYELIKLLGAPDGNVCVVGDTDQSIYGFRGADIRNMLNFEKDFPSVTTIVLDRNYRSTQRILDAANAVISNNKDRLEKNLWTDVGDGAKIVVHHAEDDGGEARYIVDQVNQLTSTGNYKRADCVVLYRTNAQSRSLEEALLGDGQAYQILGATRFYDRAEVKDTVAYLTLIVNPANDVAVERVINTPRRGIGDKTVELLANYAAQHQMPLLEACRHVDQVNGLGARAVAAVKAFVSTIDDLQTLLGQPDLELASLVNEVITISGIREFYVEQDTPEALAKLENLNELVQGAEDFATHDIDIDDDTNGLAAYLERVSLLGEQDHLGDASERITLMTIHNAKGLEYPVVFVAGLEEGIFPHEMSLGTPEGLQEERRLAYVAITRAEQRLFLTRAKQRTLYGRATLNTPSRFLREVPDNLVDGSTTVGRPKQIKNRLAAARKRVAETPTFVVGEIVTHAHFGRGVVLDLPDG